MKMPTSTLPHAFIIVEGPIGVGKTTLARRLAQSFNYDPILEAPEENPFLERFYQNSKQVALPTQLFFLFQRMQQLQKLRQTDLFRPVRVADFLLEKDRLFAQINLDDDEFKLYEKIYHHLTPQIPKPDLVIYLQAPVEVLLHRIQKRAIAIERLITRDYLQTVNDAYTRYFLYYEATPLLIVNATEIDLVSNEMDYNQLINHIQSIQKGRHYFNPQTSL